MKRARGVAIGCAKVVAVTTLTLLAAACSATATEAGEKVTPGDSLGAVVAGDSLRALPRAVTVAEREGIVANNAFSLRLLREATRASSGNVLLSPFSVSTALGLTMNGAAGTTEQAMRTTLEWGSRARAEINTAYRELSSLLPTLDPAVTFKSANAVWTRDPFRATPEFVADAASYFKANVSNAATPEAMFAAVNTWGNQATEGLVPQVLQDPPPPDLTMLLANAVLFKGQWRERFDPAKTAPAPFQLESGAAVSVPMMTRSGGFRAAFDIDAVAAELPYGNAAYSMLVIVPRTATIGSYVANFDSTALARILERLSPQNSTPLFMPRFRVSASRELRPVLESMGMSVAFSDLASFPRLMTSGSHRLEFVRHAVTVDVDEAGTKAAAVTVVGVVLTSAPQPIVVNRPFLFVIRERFTGALLFTGVVRDPRQ